MKYRFKHIVEYGVVRLLYLALNILPACVAMRVGIGLAWLAHGLARSRVKTAQARIREVFGSQMPEAEVRRIAWISLRNTFLNGVEIMRMARINRAWVESHIAQYNEIDPLRDHLRSGRGAILVVPHMGNWDLAGVALKSMGLPVFFVVGHQKNPLTDAFLNRMRAGPGIETISRHDGPLRKVIRHLRAGKLLAIMTDVRSRSPGVSVRFLGKDANVTGGLGLFARQAGVPVFPAVTVREGVSKHRWKVFEPIFPDVTVEKGEDARRITQKVMDMYDRAIRAQPEQYFWYNKRWVLEPYRSAETIGKASPSIPGTATPHAMSFLG